MDNETNNQSTHPEWEDFMDESTYEEQYKKFLGFTRNYEKWYLKKSDASQFVSKQGLLLSLYALILYFAVNKGLVASLTDYSSLWLVLFPTIIVIIGALPAIGEFSDEFNFKNYKLWYYLLYFIPLIFECLSLSFEAIPYLLGTLGLGSSIIFYLINRLDGYTRAWSRYRTAGFKSSINHMRYKGDHISEQEAQRVLFNIIENEVVDRHKDIISDFHYFGDKVNGLMPTKVTK